MKKTILSIISCVAFLIAPQVSALTQAELAKAAQAQGSNLPVDDAARSQWQSTHYGPIQSQQVGPTEQEQSIKPFAAELFQGGFRGLRSDGLNANYRLLPGDQVTLRVWGAVEIDRVLPVDTQGNIFIPTVGPVKVQGVTHSQLNQVVSAAIRQTYSKQVKVYTNLQGVQPVSVFVAGFVKSPGRYSGVPSDSALMFLDQANGIDDQLGSYRNIRLLRDGKVLAELDLYQYMLHGELAHPQLQDGDTLLVAPRGASVLVTGDIGRPYRFELPPQAQGMAILELAQLSPAVTHVLQRGTRSQNPIAHYLTLNEFKQQAVANGDELVFVADSKDQQIVVQLEGTFTGQSNFVLPKNTTLMELLNSVAINPMETDYRQISLRRVSVAERQKQALEESLRRLEATYLGAPSSTAEESAIRVKEAELISRFVQQARQIEPDGTMVVTSQNQLVDVRLQDGDVITLPKRSNTVIITGEVFVPKSVVYLAGRNVLDYIDSAGGFSQHADKKRILIVRQNGEVLAASDAAVQPGDEILVLPVASTKNLQLAATLTQILYQVAIAAKVVLDL